MRQGRSRRGRATTTTTTTTAAAAAARGSDEANARAWRRGDWNGPSRGESYVCRRATACFASPPRDGRPATRGRHDRDIDRDRRRAGAVSYGAAGYGMSQVPLIRAGIEEKLRRERARKGALGDALPPGAASDRKVHTP